jgi:hypothetical protein
MEISVVRNRLRDTIERAKRHAAERRARNEDGERAYREFLEQIAIPLVRQLANALKVDGYHFTVSTPSGSVRLMSDRRAEDFIELALDTSGEVPLVIGHTSRLWGPDIVETEHPMASGKPGAITEEELLEFLLKELEPFVER